MIIIVYFLVVLVLEDLLQLFCLCLNLFLSNRFFWWALGLVFMGGWEIGMEGDGG
jgi:hypothetical protein